MKRKTSWPKISIIVLTLNEAQYLNKCLRSIRTQAYPQDKIEIVIVDNGSKDNSVKIAKLFDARVFIRKNSDVYSNWSYALHKITGDFTYMIDQDIELRGKDFFKKMLSPLLKDKRLIASFTRKYPRADQSWVTRFISYHPAQCDPLYEFLTPSVEESFTEINTNYIVCKFILGKVPPFGRMFYRVEYLQKTQSWNQNRVFDHDLVIKSIKAGYNFFVYIPCAGLYHHHANSLGHLLQKRVRNLHMHYFPYHNETEYKWIDVSNKKDILKMVFWIIYANLFIPATIRGFFRFLKYKDPVLLMEPVVTITITDVLLIEFLKNKVGRSIFYNSFRTLLNTKMR